MKSSTNKFTGISFNPFWFIDSDYKDSFLTILSAYIMEISIPRKMISILKQDLGKPDLRWLQFVSTLKFYNKP